MAKKLKLAILGSVGVPANYGGFETLADKLVTHLSEQLDITVFCSGLQYSKKLKEYKGAKLEYIGLSANGIQSVPYDIISIRKAYNEHDILLILGVAGMISMPLLKLRKAKPKIIVHIDGMEWKREKWKWFAKLYLRSSEKLGILISNRVIADNQAILDYLPKKIKKKTSMIAYGGDHAVYEPKDVNLLKRLEIKQNVPYAFSVCRIVPENNIKTILKAFRALKKELVLVGNWYDSNYGIEIWREFHQEPTINLIHPIYNQSSLDSLRSNCEIYIHGHSAGGTNPSLVEAMYLGLPILCFDVSFNRNTMGGRGNFFKDEDSLIKLLQKNTFDNELISFHKSYAKEHYTWESIASQYYNLFTEL
tara:strand:+ start:303 stop:1391 length:1089 start_codon:yes stop_codon:yes gene_type:complete